MLSSALEEDGELSHQACTMVVVDKAGSHDRDTAAEHESYADDDQSKEIRLSVMIRDGTAG